VAYVRWALRGRQGGISRASVSSSAVHQGGISKLGRGTVACVTVACVHCVLPVVAQCKCTRGSDCWSG
jgi:hypothetical protein